MASVKEIYWLAAMLDAEGSFYIYKHPKYNSVYPEMTFQTSDYDIACRVAAITKAATISRVKPYGSSKLRAYKIRFQSTKAVQWMMTLYPIMSIRRKAKIKECLEVWKGLVDGRKKEGGAYRTAKSRNPWMLKPKLVDSPKPLVNPFEKK